MFTLSWPLLLGILVGSTRCIPVPQNMCKDLTEGFYDHPSTISHEMTIFRPITGIEEARNDPPPRSPHDRTTKKRAPVSLAKVACYTGMATAAYHAVQSVRNFLHGDHQRCKTHAVTASLAALSGAVTSSAITLAKQAKIRSSHSQQQRRE